MLSPKHWTTWQFPDAWLIYLFGFVAQSVKNLPVMQETQVRFLCGKDPLEKETATQSNILA